MPTNRVYLEQGKRFFFAVSLDWPGWCRRAASAELAVEELERYQQRYARIVTGTFKPGAIEVVGTVKGTPTTDFGAPDGLGPWDSTPATRAQRRRHVQLLMDCWKYFDAVAKRAPATLQRGPRGGGRDRDDVLEHVRESERAYGRAIGVRVPPRTPWSEQRLAIVSALETGVENERWPQDYALRRIAWHVTDHVWEIEDKSVK